MDHFPTSTASTTAVAISPRKNNRRSLRLEKRGVLNHTNDATSLPIELSHERPVDGVESPPSSASFFCKTPKRTTSQTKPETPTTSSFILSPTVSRLVLLGEDPYGDHPYVPATVPTSLVISRPRTVIGRDPSRCHIVVDSEKYIGSFKYKILI